MYSKIKTWELKKKKQINTDRLIKFKPVFESTL